MANRMSEKVKYKVIDKFRPFLKRNQFVGFHLSEIIDDYDSSAALEQSIIVMDWMVEEILRRANKDSMIWTVMFLKTAKKQKNNAPTLKQISRDLQFDRMGPEICFAPRSDLTYERPNISLEIPILMSDTRFHSQNLYSFYQWLQWSEDFGSDVYHRFVKRIFDPRGINLNVSAKELVINP